MAKQKANTAAAASNDRIEASAPATILTPTAKNDPAATARAEVAAKTFDLLTYSRTLKDTTLKTYDELHEEMIRSDRLEKFKGELKDKYREGDLNLVVLGTGGTFQSAKTDRGIMPTGNLQESFEAMRLPYNSNEIHLNLFEIFNFDSAKLRTGEHVRFIADVLIDLLKECSGIIDGFIVTHGTDTMAETANYLSLILGRGLKKPIIFTGSQEPARMKNTDATNNMDNCLKVHQFFADEGIHPAEVMVLCGDELVRASDVIKNSDRSSQAFIAYNSRPLLRVDNRLVKTWGEGLSPRLLKARPDIPFTPYNQVLGAADIPITKLADISEEQVAKVLLNNQRSIFGLLGSSTCPNTHAELLAAASKRGKMTVLQIPFHDALLLPGMYEAGATLADSGIPLIKGTQSFIKAKMNWLWSNLKIRTKEEQGLGEIIEDRQQQDQFISLLCANNVGEWDEA